MKYKRIPFLLFKEYIYVCTYIAFKETFFMKELKMSVNLKRMQGASENPLLVCMVRLIPAVYYTNTTVNGNIVFDQKFSNWFFTFRSHRFSFRD